MGYVITTGVGMKEIILAAAIIIICAASAQSRPIKNLAFIDHYNLRYTYQSDENMLRSQAAEIKKNLDKAKQYGVNTYVLFSRSFEYLVNYDFEIEGLGDLSDVVWPEGCEHRQYQQLYARYLNEVLDYAERVGIKVIFHTNQFDFPDKLYEMAGEKISGSARVCPAKKMTYDALSGKMAEFFKLFPKCSGMQITISETQVKPTECNCEACRDMSEGQRFAKVVQTVYEVAKPLGKEVSIRTWGGFATPGNIALLPDDVICSTKCTSGDFHLTSRTSDVIGENADRQEVEFDSWGEYFGYNYFPCYMGDIFAERIKLCADKNVDRIALRLNWNHDINHIFSRSFGNEVNVYMFTRLAQQPDTNPDDLLRKYIAELYPESAREAAFRLYKRSGDLQRVWLTIGSDTFYDHSRIFGNWGKGYLDRTYGNGGKQLPQGYNTVVEVLDKRRLRIDDAYDEAKQLIDALAPDVPQDWTRELHRGARTAWFTAHGITDSLQVYAAYRETEQGRPLPDIRELEKSLRTRARMWGIAEPNSFSIMGGRNPIHVVEELREKEVDSE